MNIFNRIVMVLLIVLKIALVAFVMIRPDLASDWVNRGVAFFDANVTDTAGWFSRWFLPIGAAILLLLLVLLYLEIRKTQHKAVRIQTQDGGNARLDISSVAQSVEYRVDELAGVRKVKTRITSRGKDVDVAVDLDTSPSVNIPVLTDQIIGLCRDIVETQLGIKIHGPVKVNIRHEPYPRGTMPSTGALAKEPVNAPPAGIKPAAPVAADTASWSGTAAAASNANAAPKSEEQKPQGSGDSSGW